jgi:hypothetical protein
MAFGKLVGFLIAFGLGAVLVPGCSKQGEGERCDKVAAGNDDCDSGLVCVDANELADESTDRCCPPEGEAFSDSRCAPGGTVGAGGSGAGGTSSSAGAPATDQGGAPATDQGGAPATDQGGAPATDQGGAPATSETSGAGGA